MEIPIILQVALISASLAIVGLAVCIIFFTIEARRQLRQLAVSAEQMKEDVRVLVQDSHELIRNGTEVTKRVSQQIDEVEKVVHIVHRWTERADRLVDEVGSAIEPPVFTAVRNVNIVRKGVSAFLQSLLH